jgi:excisionase family DNA binding protein
MMIFDDESYLDVEMVSKYLHVAKSTIYKWVSEDYIPYIKLGKTTRFIKNDIDEWALSMRKNSIDIDLPEIPTYRKTG